MAIEYMQESKDIVDNPDKFIQGLASEEEAKQSQEMFQSNDMSKLVKTYLEEDIPDTISKKIKTHFWAIMGNTIKLSFFEKEDILDFELLFEQEKINYIMSLPPGEFTFEDTKMLDSLKTYSAAAIRRAIGTNYHKFNERIILGGSINQVIRSNTENMNPIKDGGIFGKIKSMF